LNQIVLAYTQVGAKAAAKRAAKEAQAGSSDKAANGGGKSGKKGQPKQRARDEIVPWGWEQAAKDERKAKNVAKTQVGEHIHCATLSHGQLPSSPHRWHLPACRPSKPPSWPRRWPTWAWSRRRAGLRAV
jgi:hypothetical protein